MIDIAVSGRGSTTPDASHDADSLLSQARELLAGVVAFQSLQHDYYDEAWTQNNIGLAFYYAGRYDEAIKAYERALPPYVQLHYRFGQAQVHQNIALVEYELGRLAQSAPHFQETLKLISRDENPQLVARVLGNSALVSRDSGKSDKALQELNESLALARTIQDSSQEAVALHHLGSVYASLGDEDRALASYRQALAKFQILKHARGQTACLRAMANILRRRGQAAESLDLDRRALSLAGTTSSQPPLLVQIAKDLISLRKLDEASATLSQVLDSSEASDEVDRARALQQRAVLRAVAGKTRESESDLKAALKTFRAYELPLDEFDAWVALARLMRARGSIDEAFATIDKALTLAEAIRLQSANPELRSTVLQPLRPAFELKISMLARQYAETGALSPARQALATRSLETAEQARTRALSDYQALDMNAPGLDPSLIARRKDLYRELAGRRVRLEALLDRGDLNGSQSQMIRSEIGQLRQELDQIDARIGSASEKLRAQHAASYKQISLPLAKVPPGTAVIEYFWGEKESFAWVLTHGTIAMTSLGDSATIGSVANELHDSLRGFGRFPKSARLAAAEKLYGLVIGPIEREVSERHTLIFALDGPLHYVPFATLRYKREGHMEFLIESHDVAATPSIQLFLQPVPERRAPSNLKPMLLVDDPVYDPGDPRLARAQPDLHPRKEPHAPRRDQPAASASLVPPLALVRGPPATAFLPRLPGAAEEAAQIESLMAPGSVDRLEGLAANRERFLAAGLDRYRLIHVASHAATDSETPQASALILSTVDANGNPIDGRVLGADLMSVLLNADTVVLSGCDTALGKDVAGEGLMGLEYAVVARGARSVISSLWPAIDSITARLMRDFYSTLLRQHSSIVSAWSSAARAALNGPYSDPGTWGAFVLTLSHAEEIQAPADDPPSATIHLHRGKNE
jgi:CHAT domain-containing protein